MTAEGGADLFCPDVEIRPGMLAGTRSLVNRRKGEALIHFSAEHSIEGRYHALFSED